jgi:hypothetical protein
MSIGSMQGRIAPTAGVCTGDLDAGATRLLVPGFVAVLAPVLARVLATLVLALLIGANCAMAQQENACAASDPRQACSYQCCGRRSCPPSCEVDCVKVCVDACGSQTRSLAYDSRKRDLQLRCGNKGAR